ncbi:hypothetical protein DUY81_09010 [Acidipropionibacterium acidipropionici]|jgi:Flp pilus assembly protein TadG|uniref:Putative Flp pilus-assembly TadG-like N-terminal domain-containing protein n=1 Tax=Acidipropionibacterium acidipropionici TaxID=1748 RepID=A0AAC8YDU7_9ACTN|nr:pilus assembly protein TadG-related protein [Acidipropionibacterium acidipropionici]AMS04564.1 hypothetical protein AXH35_02775 [Acidipropionibacterium acidipropionici]AOZ46056.1 hypothetical protein A8L58_04240 [Acidipropionibacterium acidipropionici]AZP37919.1 hypothetical protein DUY81_09010 [Acidipropionibacterium acidipropionici]
MSPHRRRPAPVHDQRGAGLSVAAAVLLPCLILAGGLAVDGAQQARARRQAHAVAAAAARTGCDHASAAELVGRPDPAAARRAAMAAAGATSGEGATMSARAELEGGRLSVTVDATRATLILSVIGLDTVTGSATVTCLLVPR